jgi:hypothetical protein
MYGPVISVAREDIHLAGIPVMLKGRFQQFNPTILPWAIVGLDGKIYLFDPWDISAYRKDTSSQIRVTLLKDRNNNVLRTANIAEYLTFFRPSGSANFTASDLYQIVLGNRDPNYLWEKDGLKLMASYEQMPRYNPVSQQTRTKK